MTSWIVRICDEAIRAYQRWISAYTLPRCKYYPTCSSYARQALHIHGFTKGMILAAWRLMRCNPFSLGGVDYPPLPGQWHSAPYHQMSCEELHAYWDRIDADAASSKEHIDPQVVPDVSAS